MRALMVSRSGSSRSLGQRIERGEGAHWEATPLASAVSACAAGSTWSSSRVT